MVRRHVTASRAFVLLLLGMGIGAVLFLSRGLSPDAVKAQVEIALRRYLKAEFSLDDVSLDLQAGVELTGLKVFYDRDLNLPPAIEAESVSLTMDHSELLAGEVRIRQMDVKGLILRLRQETRGEGLPGLYGIFAEPETDPLASGSTRPGLPTYPVVRVQPGSRGSRVVLLDPQILADGAPVRLDCDRFEAQPDGPRYDINARFDAEKLGKVDVHVSFDNLEGRVSVRGRIERLEWTQHDFGRLDPKLRRMMPPIEVDGTATVSMEAEARLRPIQITRLTGSAELSGLDGTFGNLWTYQRFGMPFGLRDGHCRLEYDGTFVEVSKLEATFVNPQGEKGRLRIGARVRLDDPAAESDFSLSGEHMRLSTHDLRMLLDSPLVDDVVDRYLPAGRFDFSSSVRLREGQPERVTVELRISDGQFNYAGRLDEMTRQRFGFRYPLDRCSGTIRIESNVPTPRGLCDRIEIRDMSGHNRIARRVEGGPQDVAVSARGTIVSYGLAGGEEEQSVDLEIMVRDLPIDDKLAGAFATTPGGVPYRAFDLTGWADLVTIRVKREAFKDTRERAQYDIRLRDCAMAYKDFPLRLIGMSGRVLSSEEYSGPGGTLVRTMTVENLEGTVIDGGSFEASGTLVQSEGGSDEIGVELNATGIVLGRSLGRAIRLCPLVDRSVSDLWYKLRPSGTVDATIRVGNGEKTDVTIRLGGDARVAGYGDVDCPITGLTGAIRFEDGRLRLDGIEGRIRGARVIVENNAEWDQAPAIEVHAIDLPLDEQVQALAREFAPESARPLRRLALQAGSKTDLTLQVRPGEPPHYAVTLDRLDLRCRVLEEVVEVTGGPLTIDSDRISAGGIHLRSGDESALIREFTAPRDGATETRVLLDATNLAPRGAIRRLITDEVRGILGDNLRLDCHGIEVAFDPAARTLTLNGEAEFRRHSLPREKVDALEPTGRVKLVDLRIQLPGTRGGKIRFNGLIGFQGLNMNLPIGMRDLAGELRVGEGVIEGDTVRIGGAVSGGEAMIFGRYFDKLGFNVAFNPNYLKLTNIDGRFYGGSFRGSVAIHRGSPGAFDIRLAASGVDLGELLKEDLAHDQPMSGVLGAHLELRSPSGDIYDMEGSGWIEIAEGQLFRVPGLRSFLTALGRVTPIRDTPRFKEATVKFEVESENLLIEKLRLSTALNDINAYGTVSIYGDLNLKIEPQITRLIDLPRLVNIPVLSTLADLWHRTVYGIRMRGTIDSPDLVIQPLPFIARESDSKPFTQSPHAGYAKRMRPRVLP